MHNTIPSVTLKDGRSLPRIGLGTWAMSDAEAIAACRVGIELGYRLIDTATVYLNETGVGQGIAASGLPRGELFVTSKVRGEDMGFDATLKAFETSTKKLGLDYLDLYLIHWPVPGRDLYVETWKAMVQLQQEGRIRSIGVSNFRPNEIERLVAETGAMPVVNQIELHPGFQQGPARAWHEKMGIVVESWSPLARGAVFDAPALKAAAAAHGKSVAQIVLRWHIQLGCMVIPKSANAQRMAANLDIFNFTLSDAEMAAIATLDGMTGRTGPDPDSWQG